MYYRIILNGIDFVFDYEGKHCSGGFVTTRWVKAKTTEEAEQKAVNLVKNDNALHELLVKTEQSAPRVLLEELSSVSWLEYITKKPGKGYTFYSNENEEATSA